MECSHTFEDGDNRPLIKVTQKANLICFIEASVSTWCWGCIKWIKTG